MNAAKKPGSDKTFRNVMIMGIIIGLIAVALLIGKFRRPEPRPPAPAAPPAEPAPAPAPQPAEAPETPRAVIDYSKLDKDDAVDRLMDQRKETYGVDAGVDMIVRSDEAVKVGDVTISMQEILEKIRLKKGDVLEKDLSGAGSAPKKELSREALLERLESAEERFHALEKELAGPAVTADADAFREKKQEHLELGKIVSEYRRLKETEADLAELEALLTEEDADIEKALSGEIETLKRQKAALEAELVEKLFPDLPPDAGPPDPETLEKALKQTEARFWALEKRLNAPEATAEPDRLPELMREYQALSDIVGRYHASQNIQSGIDEKEALLAGDGDAARERISEKIAALTARKAVTEQILRDKIMAEEDPDVFGIYVVQPGDNIWNIHFNFLKNYFKNRGISLSPQADEPDAGGRSSGVGKILKFSENMVFIYNVRERRLSENLNLIHPLSKIVVFNMGEALALLRRIDYENISRIQYDGETLWIPSQ